MGESTLRAEPIMRAHMNRTQKLILFVLSVFSMRLALPATDQPVSWRDRAFSPVANPLFFEDPHIRTKIRPIFAYHRIADDLLNGAGLTGVSEGDAR